MHLLMSSANASFSPFAHLSKLDTTCTEGDCELGEASKLAVPVPLSVGMTELKGGGGGCAQLAAIATAAHYTAKISLAQLELQRGLRGEGVDVEGVSTPLNGSEGHEEQSWADKSRTRFSLDTHCTHIVVLQSRALVALTHPARNPRAGLRAHLPRARPRLASLARAQRAQVHANTHCPARTVGSKRAGEQVRAERGCAASNSRSSRRGSTSHGADKATDAPDLARTKKKRCNNSTTTNEGPKEEGQHAKNGLI